LPDCAIVREDREIQKIGIRDSIRMKGVKKEISKKEMCKECGTVVSFAI
jgi:hypothetical protein